MSHKWCVTNSTSILDSKSIPLLDPRRSVSKILWLILCACQGGKKTDNVLPSNINSCRHFWVANQPRWLVRRGRCRTCTCADVPAGLCRFAAGALRAVRLPQFNHRRSSAATVFPPLSSPKTSFRKGGVSQSQEPPLRKSRNIYSRSKLLTRSWGPNRLQNL